MRGLLRLQVCQEVFFRQVWKWKRKIKCFEDSTTILGCNYNDGLVHPENCGEIYAL